MKINVVYIMFVYSFKKGSCGEKLHHVNLSGCLYITDLTLQRLSAATGHAQSLSQAPQTMTNSELEEAETSGNEENKVLEEKEVCLNCQRSQKNFSDSCVKGTCNADTRARGCSTYVNEKQNCCRLRRKCCKLELKSANTSHELCSRAGPCQAKESNLGCCDIEVEAQPVKPCYLNSNKCEECDSQSSYSKSSSQQKKEKVCSNGGSEKLDVRNSEKLSHRNDKGQGSRTKSDLCDLYASRHGDDDQKSRMNHDQGDLPTFCSDTEITVYGSLVQEWQGCTVENLSTLSETEAGTTIQIIPKDGKIPGVKEMNQLNLKNFEEGTPVDYNPGQTYLPDFILLRNITFTESKEEKVETEKLIADPVLDGLEKGRNQTNSDQTVTTKGTDEPWRCLEYLSLSGCYQITGEGLR